MDQIIKERKGDRQFKRISRWNLIEYTIIADRNRFAKYADNAGNKNEKLTLTYFTVRNHDYPINMFGRLMSNIELEDHSIISRQNIENTTYFLEISPDKRKVRMYQEVRNED